MSGRQSQGVYMALAWLSVNPGASPVAVAGRYGVSVKSVNRALHAAGRSAEVRRVGRPRKAAGVLVLIRGLPGSGKSTRARSMHGFAHFEADMFFERGGSYSFDPAQLPAAHAWCLQRASDALQQGKAVVVSNTFTQAWEMEPYLDAAKRYGASVQIIEAKGGWPNVHGVPESAIQRMIARWEEVGPDGRPRKSAPHYTTDNPSTGTIDPRLSILTLEIGERAADTAGTTQEQTP